MIVEFDSKLSTLIVDQPRNLAKSVTVDLFVDQTLAAGNPERAGEA